mmetsp:Transcript_59202/g.176090  ORF Transcript_59202/g.176090 Transcript_59202/m.176090 type:complete len:241 (-) Transcript_59202:662-1384(-)
MHSGCGGLWQRHGGQWPRYPRHKAVLPVRHKVRGGIQLAARGLPSCWLGCSGAEQGGRGTVWCGRHRREVRALDPRAAALVPRGALVVRHREVALEHLLRRLHPEGGPGPGDRIRGVREARRRAAGRPGGHVPDRQAGGLRPGEAQGRKGGLSRLGREGGAVQRQVPEAPGVRGAQERGGVRGLRGPLRRRHCRQGDPLRRPGRALAQGGRGHAEDSRRQHELCAREGLRLPALARCGGA